MKSAMLSFIGLLLLLSCSYGYAQAINAADNSQQWFAGYSSALIDSRQNVVYKALEQPLTKHYFAQIKQVSNRDISVVLSSLKTKDPTQRLAAATAFVALASADKKYAARLISFLVKQADEHILKTISVNIRDLILNKKLTLNEESIDELVSVFQQDLPSLKAAAVRILMALHTEGIKGIPDIPGYFDSNDEEVLIAAIQSITSNEVNFLNLAIIQRLLSVESKVVKSTLRFLNRIDVGGEFPIYTVLHLSYGYLEDDSIKQLAQTALLKHAAQVSMKLSALTELLYDCKFPLSRTKIMLSILSRMGEFAKQAEPQIAKCLVKSSVYVEQAIRAMIGINANARDYINLIEGELSKPSNYDSQGAARDWIIVSAKHDATLLWHLLKIMDFTYADRRASAHKTLGQLYDDNPNTLEQLIELIGEDEDGRFALNAIAYFGPKAKNALPSIKEVIESKGSSTKKVINAIKVLSKMEHHARAYVPLLIKHLDTANYDRRIVISALGALNHLGPDIYAPWLQDILTHQPEIEDSLSESFDILALIPLCDDKPFVKKVLSEVRYKGIAIEEIGRDLKCARKHVSYFIEMWDSLSPTDKARVLSLMAELGEDAKPYINVIIGEINKESALNTHLVKALTSVLPYSTEDQLHSLSKKLIDNPELVSKVILSLDIKYQQQIATELGEALSKDTDIAIESKKMLAQMGNVAISQQSKLEKALKHKSFNVRWYSVKTLLQLGAIDNIRPAMLIEFLVHSNQGPEIINLLKNLGGIKKIPRLSLAFVEATLVDSNVDNVNFVYNGYLFSNNNKEELTVLRWIGNNESFLRAELKNHIKDKEKAIEILEDLKAVLDDQSIDSFTAVKNKVADLVAVIVSDHDWGTVKEVSLLNSLKSALDKERHSDSYLVVDTKLNSIKLYRYGYLAAAGFVIHLAVWSVLLVLYPRSKSVRAHLFWQPKIRQRLGFVYVSFCLVKFAYFRRILFEPYRDRLVADIKANYRDKTFYYPKSYVKSPQGEEMRLFEGLPRQKGQAILVGESGLGKSLYIEQCIKNSEQISVFLRADSCINGVLEAIQNKLHGLADDKLFLKALIYQGALDIYIDGFNEVSSDTRAEIRKFCEAYGDGNILITSQPLHWQPSELALVWQLQPLKQQQVLEFLAAQWDALQAESNLSQNQYNSACEHFVADVFNEKRSEVTRLQNLVVLSNPMDLAVIADLLAQDKQPTILDLRRQQYDLMAQSHQSKYMESFPFDKFCQFAFKKRLNGKLAFNYSEVKELEIANVLSTLFEHKMIHVVQDDNEPVKENHRYRFRHEKIMDFFVAQTFINNEDSRRNKHFNNPNFRGIYILLANILPLKEAQSLYEELDCNAAQKSDHSLSGKFRLILDKRRKLLSIDED